jgi:hypothetical protein
MKGGGAKFDPIQQKWVSGCQWFQLEQQMTTVQPKQMP